VETTASHLCVIITSNPRQSSYLKCVYKEMCQLFLKGARICYFTQKSGDLKSYDLQTIYAIPVDFSEVMTLARFVHFLQFQGTPKI